MIRQFGQIVGSPSFKSFKSHRTLIQYRNVDWFWKCTFAGLLYSTYPFFRVDDGDNDDAMLQNAHTRSKATGYHRMSPFRYDTLLSKLQKNCRLMTTSCDANADADSIERPKRAAEMPLQATRIRRVLHKFKILSLPTPRALTLLDPLFSYTDLRRGLKQRSKDENALRALQAEAMTARQSEDQEKIQHIFEKISSIAFGKGVTPQQREDFLAKYGCTGWTIDNLNYIVDLAFQRGIIEIGAGNGQWARAIRDHHEYILKTKVKDSIIQRFGKKSDFIVPYDNMSSLPLSPKIYHQYTKPAHDHFHPNVIHSTSHVDDARRMTNRGRVLLLVYPSPGPMALETVKAYVDIYPKGNDTVIYCGEGIGGANANNEFFEYFLNCEDTNAGDEKYRYRWCVLEVMDVLPAYGGKGYEKMFVLQRVKEKI